MYLSRYLSKLELTRIDLHLCFTLVKALAFSTCNFYRTLIFSQVLTNAQFKCYTVHIVSDGLVSRIIGTEYSYRC